MSKQELKAALERARENTRKANAHYKATWRKHSTAAGFKHVDMALEALQQSEANERALELELAQ